MTEFTLLQGLLAVSLVFSVLFFYYCVNRRHQRGVTPLTVMFVGISIWIFSDLIQIWTGPDPMAYGGMPMRLLGADLTVIGCLLFALEYTGRKGRITRGLLGLLAIKPLATLAITVSPYREYLFQVDTAGAAAATPWGYELVATPLFLGHALYGWSLLLIGISLIAHMMIRASYSYRRQITAILVALSVPLGLNMAYHTGVAPFDLTPTSFLVTASIFMYSTFRLRFLDALPVARQTVFEEMEEMVIVLDELGRIITVNAAVRETFGDTDAFVGKDVRFLFGTGTVETLRNDSEQIPVTIDGEERYLSVRISPIEDYRGDQVAEVLVCRDVTEAKQREQQLRRREEELELLKDLQSRFLRHNLRNELNVMRSNAQLVLDEDDPEQRDLQDTIQNRTDQILDWSTKARTIERMLGLESTIPIPLNATVDDVVAEIAEIHADVPIETDLEADVTVETLPQIEHALSNVIDNAARYNTSQDPRVTITARSLASAVEIRVEDNGPGIDSAELEAIRSGEERPLQHGTGLGLWLVYWVVDKSKGSLSFDTGEDGTTVTIRLPAGEEGQPTATRSVT